MCSRLMLKDLLCLNAVNEPGSLIEHLLNNKLSTTKRNTETQLGYSVTMLKPLRYGVFPFDCEVYLAPQIK